MAAINLRRPQFLASPRDNQFSGVIGGRPAG